MNSFDYWEDDFLDGNDNLKSQKIKCNKPKNNTQKTRNSKDYRRQQKQFKQKKREESV